MSPAEPTEEAAAYNYRRFAGSDNFLAFRTVLPVGSVAPDFTATLVGDGAEVRLSDYWRERDVLIEFGSLT